MRDAHTEQEKKLEMVLCTDQADRDMMQGPTILISGDSKIEEGYERSQQRDMSASFIEIKKHPR